MQVLDVYEKNLILFKSFGKKWESWKNTPHKRSNYIFPFEKYDKANFLFYVTFFPLVSRTENEPWAGTKCLGIR